MSLTAAHITKLAAKYGSVAYHYTDQCHLEGILTNGIIPSSETGHANNGGKMLPRPEHTYFYLGQADSPPSPDTICITDSPVLVTVSIFNFVPELINPDEDSFIGYSPDECEELGIAPMYIGSKYSSYGQWAHQSKLGIDDIETTLLGIEDTQTFAYHGSVAPHLLSVAALALA